MNNPIEKGMVDAIEENRIVRVPEDYAKREGLLILRRAEPSALDSPSVQKQMKLTPRLKGERKAYFDIEKYRRPWRDKNEILASLVGNFHWVVGSKRKELNLTRKQLSLAINCSEEEIKMIENGILPHNDYILINKLENFLKVNLRKDRSDQSSRLDSKAPAFHPPKWVDKINLNKKGTNAPAEELVASDIEIEDEDLDDK